MSVSLLSLVVPLFGYGLLLKDLWKKLREKALNSPNPKRTLYTYAFLFALGSVGLPLFAFSAFAFAPLYSVGFIAVLTAVSYVYLLYKLALFFLSLKPSSSPYRVEPFPTSVKIAQDPPVEVNASAFSKHAICIASTGSGKTKSVLAPLAKHFTEMGKGVLVIDPKGDTEIMSALVELLRDQGRFPEDFWYFDPMKPSYSRSYNPLYSGIKYGKPNHVAVMIIATMPKIGGTATFYENLQKEFTRSVTRLLGVLPKTGKMVNFLDLYTVVAYLPRSIEYLLDKYSAELSQEKDELARLWIKTILEESKRNREFRSYLRGLQQHLANYAFTFHPRLLNSYDPDVKIADAFSRGKLTYFSLRALDFPSGESLDVGKMILMDVQGYAAFKQRENVKSKIPDLVLIDEAHNVLVPEFQRMFEMARSAGIGITLFLQSRNQLEEIKRGMFENVFNNTFIKFLLRTEDPETRKYFAEYFGQELRYFLNVSKGGENPFKKPIDAVLPHWSEISLQRYDYRIRPEEFLNLKAGEAIIAVGEKETIGVKAKLPYFAKEVRGKPERYLVPVRDDYSWRDPDKGLCLLFELAKEDDEFRAKVEEEVTRVEDLRREVKELEEKLKDEEEAPSTEEEDEKSILSYLLLDDEVVK